MTVIFIISAVVVVLFLVLKSKVVSDVGVKPTDIPLIFERLKATGKDANFSVLIFFPPGKTSKGRCNHIQFSIDKDTIGLDWILIGKQNVQDKDKFAQFAAQQGYKFAELEMNNVKYLRVEKGDLPKLCKMVISNLYSMPSDADLKLIQEGFKWA